MWSFPQTLCTSPHYNTEEFKGTLCTSSHYDTGGFKGTLCTVLGHFTPQELPLMDNSLPDISPQLLPPKALPPRRCSGLQLASLALGLWTLVGTGSCQRHISRKARQHCFHVYLSWGVGIVNGGKCPGGKAQRRTARG